MREQANTITTADLPPCCGTGCAVCVLDLISEQNAKVAPPVDSGLCAQPTAAVAVVETVECCNTGCLICVRDYPELLSDGQPEAQMLQLLEALEQAQQPLVEAACMSQTL